MENYMELLTGLLEDSCPFPLIIEIGGKEWVINISPKGVDLPHRIKKLIGVKAQANSILISIARSAFADCGVSKTDQFHGASFQEKGSYMMLRIDKPLRPRDVAPLIARFLNAYVTSVGRGRS